jgi:hypothetical protein
VVGAVVEHDPAIAPEVEKIFVREWNLGERPSRMLVQINPE